MISGTSSFGVTFLLGKCHSLCFPIGSSVLNFATESILSGRPCGNPSLSGPNFTTNMSSVPAKYKSRLVGYGHFETAEGLRTDSRAGDVDSRNMVCSWCARLHSLMRLHERILSRTRNRSNLVVPYPS